MKNQPDRIRLDLCSRVLAVHLRQDVQERLPKFANSHKPLAELPGKGSPTDPLRPSFGDPVKALSKPSVQTRRSSSMVAKRRIQSRFSLSTRMNRSAQPLPWGSRTKAGELARPRKRTSAWKWWLTYWLP